MSAYCCILRPLFRLLVDVRSYGTVARLSIVPVWSNTDGAAAPVMLSINKWLPAG